MMDAHGISRTGRSRLATNAHTKPMAPQSAAPKSVLVVEDDPTLSTLLEHALSDRGISVITALDGKAALDRIDEAAPMLLLLDMLLPDRNGLDVLAYLRGDSRTAAVPVIVMTNTADPRYRETAERLGVQGYLVKTNSALKDIVDAVEALLAR